MFFDAHPPERLIIPRCGPHYARPQAPFAAGGDIRRFEMWLPRASLAGMTTLADIRSRVRTDLHDTTSGAHRWNDDDLDRHIARALDDISRAIPREDSATLATIPGSRDLSLATLTGLIAVEAVEYPAGEYPPTYVAFATWEGVLTLHSQAEPAGSDARIFYAARHTLDGSGTTLPGYLEDLVATGASAYAALEWSAYAIDSLNTGGEGVARQYASWARARQTAFQQLLKHHARSRSLRPRRLFVPA